MAVDLPAQGTFFASSHVTGRLLVEKEEEKEFKYIHISLTGRGEVRWSDDSSEREKTAECKYLHETQMVWNKDDHNGAPLAMGTHTFRFQFHLPLHLPSSFEGTVGSVRYELYGRIATHVSKFDHVVEIAIPVMGIVDINSIPSLLRPARIQLQNRLWSFCCCLSRVSMTVDLGRTAYCMGENIALNVSLENGSSHDVTISATLDSNW